ncbi:hypothetical protein K488DRAFT_82796 [Vararia minispora EC-137]|uniref:Uncharacterized protein n=1 Tax=Vararia minispora EC-137 TaxID=1314806 RepID=A0ACB8QVP8_9AGAM|nr:hypothetical protein K488DRAFT_82796 [Vararia minispora EC-137]
MSSDPLKRVRVAALFFSFAFAIIGLSVGINALVKGNQTRTRLSSSIPAGATVTVDTSNVTNCGIVVTTTCAVIALITFVLFVGNILLWRRHDAASGRIGLLNRTLALQAVVLAFFALWLFATIIPFDVFFANDAVGVSATFLGAPIPRSFIDQIAAALGIPTRYRDFGFLRLLAILPWFTVLFTSLAATVLLTASRHIAASSFVERQPTLMEKPIDA